MNLQKIKLNERGSFELKMTSINHQKSPYSNTNSISAENFLETMQKENVKKRIEQEHADILARVDSMNLKHESGEIQVQNNSYCFQSCLPMIVNSDFRHVTVNSNYYDYVDGYERKQKFICGRNPEFDTIHIFLQTVWDNNVNIIVTFYNSSSDVGAYPYWMLKVNSNEKHGKYKIKVIRVITNSFWVSTTLRLTYRDHCHRIIRHFCYTRWPQHSLWYDAKSILKLIFEVNTLNEYMNAWPFTRRSINRSPILIHCNDDLNRSTAFCLLDISISMFKNMKTVCVPEIFMMLQQQRKGCIAKVSHYVFCYSALYQYVSEHINDDEINFNRASLCLAKKSIGSRVKKFSLS